MTDLKKLNEIKHNLLKNFVDFNEEFFIDLFKFIKIAEEDKFAKNLNTLDSKTLEKLRWLSVFTKNLEHSTNKKKALREAIADFKITEQNLEITQKRLQQGLFISGFYAKSLTKLEIDIFKEFIEDIYTIIFKTLSEKNKPISYSLPQDDLGLLSYNGGQEKFTGETARIFCYFVSSNNEICSIDLYKEYRMAKFPNLDKKIDSNIFNATIKSINRRLGKQIGINQNPIITQLKSKTKTRANEYRLNTKLQIILNNN